MLDIAKKKNDKKCTCANLYLIYFFNFKENINIYKHPSVKNFGFSVSYFMVQALHG